MRSLTFAKAAAALALLCTPASAALVNGNFDADPVANGSSTCSGTIGFTGWTSFGNTCGTGLHNPDATQYPGGLAPSGDNVAYHNGNAGFWQAASDIYTAGTTYTFKGKNYWKLTDESIAKGYPKTISKDWGGLPSDVDAAFTWTNGKTYFFKGSKYWRFTNLA